MDFVKLHQEQCANRFRSSYGLVWDRAEYIVKSKSAIRVR